MPSFERIAMTSIFTALEDIGLGVAPRPPIEPAIEPMTPLFGDAIDQVVVDDSGLYEKIAQRIDVAKSVGSAVDALKNGSMGMQATTGSALGVAIECLLNTIGEKAPSVKYLPQASYRARTQNAAVAVEAYGATLAAVWKRLMEMLREFAAFIKKSVAARIAAITSLKTKVGKAEAFVAQKRKAMPEMNAPVINRPFFTDANLAARLCLANGSVPQGAELLRKALTHFATMRHLYDANEHVFKSAGLKLGQAADRISTDSTEFPTLIGDALAELQTEIIHHAYMGSEYEQQPGVKLFEEPLVFGGRSYFRTTVNSVTEFNLGDMVSKTGPSTNAREFDPEQRLYCLSDKNPEELLAAIRAHVSVQSTYLNLIEGIEKSLDRINKAIEQGISRGELVDAAEQRGRQVSKAISLMMGQVNSVVNDLAVYDNRVGDALITYAIKSVA
jgi:hypothetical protein